MCEGGWCLKLGVDVLVMTGNSQSGATQAKCEVKYTSVAAVCGEKEEIQRDD